MAQQIMNAGLETGLSCGLMKYSHFSSLDTPRVLTHLRHTFLSLHCKKGDIYVLDSIDREDFL